MTNQYYGWQPDKPDIRDHTFKISKPLKALPPSVDLRPKMPPVYDQGQLGSCTANAIAGAIQFEQMKLGLPNFVASRLFIYYNERFKEGTVDSDSGAEIRDGMKVVADGFPKEYWWPYDISKFTTKAPNWVYRRSLEHKVIQYARVNQDLDSVQQCLAAGNPIVFGFSVYTAFESHSVAQTGQLNLPRKNESLLGGHAVVCCGYDNKTQRFLIRNSWNTDWGMKGYFTMPYRYMLNDALADDLWVLSLLT